MCTYLGARLLTKSLIFLHAGTRVVLREAVQSTKVLPLRINENHFELKWKANSMEHIY